MKYTRDFKLGAIQRFMSGSAGYKRTARQLGIAPSMLRRWVAHFRLHGEDSLVRGRHEYTSDFKRSVLQHMWDNALSLRQTAAHFNIPNSTTINQWVRWYKRQTEEATSATVPPLMITPPPNPGTTQSKDDERSREELLTELQHLRMENAYLKKLKALVDAKSATSKKRK